MSARNAVLASWYRAQKLAHAVVVFLVAQPFPFGVAVCWSDQQECNEELGILALIATVGIVYNHRTPAFRVSAMVNR